MRISQKRAMSIAMPLVMSTLMSVTLYLLHKPTNQAFWQFWPKIWLTVFPIAIIYAQIVHPIVEKIIGYFYAKHPEKK